MVAGAARRVSGGRPFRPPGTHGVHDMRGLIAAGLVAGLVGLAGAQDKKSDPIGTWKCEYEVACQKRESTLKIKKDGDKLVGTMTWQDKKESKLKDVKLKDGELTFSAEREIMDNKFTIEYKLKVDGDKIKGKAEADIGGEKREFEIEGKRVKDEKDDK